MDFEEGNPEEVAVPIVPKKLTAAEKKALAKRRAAQLKLEKKNQEQEAQRQIKRDELTREQKFGDVNRKKLEKRWKQTLLDIKIPILKKEFQVALNVVEMWFEAKDFKISLKMDDLDDTHHQAEFNNRAHLEKIENFIALFSDQINHLNAKYKEDLLKLKTEKTESFKTLSLRQELNDDHLKLMIYGLESENKHELKNLRCEFMSQINGETTWYNYGYGILKVNSKTVFEQLWKGYNEVFGQFLKHTAEKKKQYDKLQKNVVEKSDEITRQIQKILDYQDLLEKLKGAQENKKRDLCKLEMDLINERDRFNRSYRILRKKLIFHSKNDEKKLIKLTNMCHYTQTLLRDIKSKGEKILKYMTLCSKYETLNEKVRPFPITIGRTESDIGLKSTFQIELREMCHPMQAFCQKYSQADSVKEILQEEAIVLEQENKHLKMSIKKYCDKAACKCVFPNIGPMSKPKPPKPIVVIIE